MPLHWHPPFCLQIKWPAIAAEPFNLLNTPQFNNPAASIGAAGVGSISSAGSKPTFQRTSRQVQFAMKFYF
jgi:hypothetical protein